MSTQNSSRSAKSFPGNGIDPPHMQSSLSPQGFGLYNSQCGAGDAASIEDSTSIASGLSALKKQTIPYNEHLTSHPQHDSSNVSAAMKDSNWNVTGNENLTAHSTKADPTDGVGRNFINTTTAPSFDSNPFGNLSNGSRNIIDAKALEKSQQQYQQQQQHYPSNNSFTGSRAAATSMGNVKVEHADFDRDRQKDRLIDSLTKSDMITCLPGFKKGPLFPRMNGGGGSRFNDKVTPRMAPLHMNQNASVNSSAPLSVVRGPITPSSSYSRQTPATLPQILNYQKNGRSIDGAIIPIGSVNGSATNGNSNVSGGSVTSTSNGNGFIRRTPPPSPITRAKDAIGRAQNEISKINTFMESEEDRRRPPGAWKNMGTPFCSEPLTKSAQRQQKAQYRIELERQIQASKMRKAEEERKEKDSNDHPLGPEYAHPALTYYNPPQKIFGGGDQGGTSPTTTTAAAAITKYIKEKYALDISASGGSGGGSGNTIGTYTSGYPQETDVGGSTTALGRIAPLQQTKKEKALANLMKSRMHPGGTGNGDQNHGNASRPLPMNQLQTGGTGLHNGMAMQPGNGPRFPPQQIQQQLQQQQSNNQQVQAFVGHANPSSSSQQQYNYQQQPQQQQQQQHPGYGLQQYHQHAYPPGTYPNRSYGVNPTTWPMPVYPTYPPYYGAYSQPMYPSANQVPVNPQQQQLQNQQNLNFHSPSLPPSKPSNLRSILHDRHADEESGDDAEDDPGIDFEILKEKAYKAQKIWQTSDELPDPGLRAAVYKAELRKQIDEDRKRKAERVAREKEEDERIERKIREFHEDERRRLKVEQQTRAELEGYHRQKVQRKRNDAFTVTRHQERRGKETRPRSRSSLLAEKLASFGPDAGDFEDPSDSYQFYDKKFEDNEDSYEFAENEFETPMIEEQNKKSVRRCSPPVPVVQKKDQLRRNYNIGQYWIEVKIEDLIQYDEELSGKIKEFPTEFINVFEEAAKEVVDELTTPRPPDQEKVEDIQVMLVSDAEPIKIRELRSEKVSKLEKISGIVLTATGVRSKAVKISLMCRSCRSVLPNIPVKPGLEGYALPRKCTTNQGTQAGQVKCPLDPYFILPDRCDCVDFQLLKLQESPDSVPSGEMPRHMPMYCDRYLCEKVVPGNRVTVTGIYSIKKASQPTKKGSEHKNTTGVRTPYFSVFGIQMEMDGSGRSAKVSYTPAEEEEFRKLAAAPDCYDRIVKSIAPSIYGSEDIKKAITCLLFAGSRKRLPDGLTRRGDINVLLLGDPVTAKSQLLKFVEKVSPIGVYTSGKGSSAAGLTASVNRDPATRNFVMEGGAMVLADGGVVCIDEFDKMREDDRVAIHEAMEQQTISIAKAGITTTLNSRCAVLAAANSIFGRWDETRGDDNIDFMPTILSRFDMIFIVKDEHSEARDTIMAKHVMRVHMNARMNEQPEQEGELSLLFLKKYIAYCKATCGPRLTLDASDKLKNRYVLMRSGNRTREEEAHKTNPIPITVRQLEAIIRMAESLAKMQLKPFASEVHIDEALRLFQISTLQAANTGNLAGVEGYTTQEDHDLLNRVESQLKRRMAIGTQVSEHTIVQDFMRQKYDERTIHKVLYTMIRRGELQHRLQRKMLYRMK